MVVGNKICSVGYEGHTRKHFWAVIGNEMSDWCSWTSMSTKEVNSGEEARILYTRRHGRSVYYEIKSEIVLAKRFCQGLCQKKDGGH